MACGLYFNAPADWGMYCPMAFVCLYFIIGLLLLRPKMIGLYLGLFQLFAVVAAPFMIGVKNLSLIDERPCYLWIWWFLFAVPS